eukprot:10450598-Ditylum_brightwellii.AAC.1
MDNITQLFLRRCKAEPIKHTIGTKISQEVEKQSESLARRNCNITLRPTSRSFQGASSQTVHVTRHRGGTRTSC